MTPEDVLIEAVNVASRHGDTPALREMYCLKLRNSIRRYAIYYAMPERNEQTTNAT